jgi:hypothetical protein
VLKILNPHHLGRDNGLIFWKHNRLSDVHRKRWNPLQISKILGNDTQWDASQICPELRESNQDSNGKISKITRADLLISNKQAAAALLQSPIVGISCWIDVLTRQYFDDLCEIENYFFHFFQQTIDLCACEFFTEIFRHRFQLTFVQCAITIFIECPEQQFHHVHLITIQCRISGNIKFITADRLSALQVDPIEVYVCAISSSLSSRATPITFLKAEKSRAPSSWCQLRRIAEETRSLLHRASS